MLRQLASFSRLILFDKPGTGLSDPVAGAPTVEQRMGDIQVVMDAVDSERAALIGYSEGGVPSAMFAATYPERGRRPGAPRDHGEVCPQPTGRATGGPSRASTTKPPR